MEFYAVIFKKHKTTRVNLKNIKQSQENPDARKYSVWFRLCESQEEENGVFHFIAVNLKCTQKLHFHSIERYNNLTF